MSQSTLGRLGAGGCLLRPPVKDVAPGQAGLGARHGEQHLRLDCRGKAHLNATGRTLRAILRGQAALPETLRAEAPLAAMRPPEQRHRGRRRCGAQGPPTDSEGSCAQWVGAAACDDTAALMTVQLVHHTIQGPLPDESKERVRKDWAGMAAN